MAALNPFAETLKSEIYVNDNLEIIQLVISENLKDSDLIRY